MIFAPPQHGKSELASVRLPAYWLGRRPDDHVILCSYGGTLAQSKSRAAREVVESGEYQELFPNVRTSLSRRAVQQWDIVSPHRGGMAAAVGVGGPVTGNGAELGIIDDPFENWERAQSQAERNRVWEWWKGTFRTRVREDGAIVLIMTRWHEDDLAGRLLRDHLDDWTVLRLPAMAETQEERDINNERMGLPEGEPDPLGRPPGAPLCPQRFSSNALDKLKIDVGSMVWSAEYQGAPILPEGNRFKREWFEYVKTSPAKGFRVRYWDKAGTAGSGDYTVGLLMSRSNDDIFYVEDVVRGQWSPGERDAIILQTAKEDKQQYGEISIWIEQEPGAAGKESAGDIIKKLAGFAAYADSPTGSKDVRLEPYAAQAEAGNVKLVEGPWGRDYLDELCALPNSTYDDQGDASSGAFNKLAEGTARLAIASYRTSLGRAGQEDARDRQRARDERRRDFRNRAAGIY
jgi:predicted phage terminase large subunit-like protein